MSEIPTAPEHEAAQDALLQKVQAEGSGLDVSDELEADHQAELAEGNITHLRSFLTGQEGEDAETVAPPNKRPLEPPLPKLRKPTKAFLKRSS